MMLSVRTVASLLVAGGCVGCTTAARPPVEDCPPPAGKTVVEPVGVPPDSDMARLQGQWEIVSVEELPGEVIRRGDASTRWEGAFSSTVIFRADRAVGYGISRFELEEAVGPKRITIYDLKGKPTFRGTYSLEGDTFVCRNDDGKVVCRPEEAVTTKNGTPVVVTTLRRVTPKE